MGGRRPGGADDADEGGGDGHGEADGGGIPVPAALDGERLDRAVALVADCSRAEAASRIEGGLVTVDGTPVTTKSRRLVAGEVLAVGGGPAPAPGPPEPDPAVVVPVVHVDDAVIVVDKPPGLVVHPGAGRSTGTLVHGLLARFPDLAGVGDDAQRPGIVHRLDRDTSGLLVVARTREAYDDLVAQLAARTARRRYTALVWGAPDAPAGAVDAPIGRAPRDRTRMAVREGGRPARTGYQVEARWADPEVARLSCTLETGRTHQIRVHLSAIGHPVVGDDRYGGDRAGLPVPRLVLHAGELGFTHPGTGEPVSFTAPLPEDLATVFAGLGPPVGADGAEADGADAGGGDGGTGGGADGARGDGP